jgi:hypothetical protein
MNSLRKCWSTIRSIRSPRIPSSVVRGPSMNSLRWKGSRRAARVSISRTKAVRLSIPLPVPGERAASMSIARSAAESPFLWMVKPRWRYLTAHKQTGVL